jgi:PAS domain S-box-containing protein
MPNIDQYQLAFDVSPMPLLLVSAAGIIRLTNASLDTLFEYDRGELVGQPVEVLVPGGVRGHHPDLRQAYLRFPTKRAMGQGRDLTGVTKTGVSIQLELGLDPAQVGDETWALVAAVDVRARKAHDERMRIALDASASAMVMVDEQGRIRFVNGATQKLFGYTMAELIGEPIECLVPDEARRAHPVYRGGFLGVNKARPMGRGVSLCARHKTGRLIPVEIALTPVETPDGRMVVATVIDLTAQIEAEQLITAKAEELAAMNAELSHFAYSASHDLKAPLSTVTGLLNFCIEDLVDGRFDEVRENIATAIEIVRRSSNKVESILSVARAGRETLALESFAIEPEIRAIWTDLTHGATAAPRLDIELCLPSGGEVTAERKTLNIIVENLASNAIRYADAAKPDRWVRIRVREDCDGLMLALADNGIGIREDGLPLVFQMFKKIDDRSQDGLGLALVRKHVERLGGKIDVASTKGVGTEFTVLLPRTE